MTILRVALRLLRLVVALPGRWLIDEIDDRKHRNGVGPLNRFQRGAVHGFVGIVALMIFSMATMPSAAATTQPAAPPRPRDTAAVRVIDGDTFELATGERVRVLGIDSCESGTPGGRDATAYAKLLLVGSIRLSAEPGVDRDRYGRLLRYVQTPTGDFGQQMVRYDHTGVYQGHNDAAPEYITQLYRMDTEHSADPSVGRECNHPQNVPQPGDQAIAR